MSPFKKLIRIIYPLIIWLGTIGIPLLVLISCIFFLTSPNERKDEEFWFIPGITAFLSIVCSLPAAILFTIAYFVCLLKKFPNRTTKIILLLVNFLNIVVTVTTTLYSFKAGFEKDTFFGICISTLILLIPSVSLILLVKIPPKQIPIETEK